MNTNKRSYEEAWVLCPSKSFSGKFYYFNTMSGETVWSLSDVEKRTPFKNTIHKITDKWHTYPEPETPPTEECSHSMQSWQYRRPECPQSSYQGNNQNMQSFGPVMLPKYAPNVKKYDIPNYVCPSPMPSVYHCQNSKPRLPFDNGPHACEVEMNSSLQSSNHYQLQHFLKPQEKMSYENFVNGDDPSPSHSQNLYKRHSHENMFDVKPSHFQNAIENKSHASLFNENQAYRSSGHFQQPRGNVCCENLFNAKKAQVFHDTQENIFRFGGPGFPKVHEKSSHDIYNIAKAATAQNSYRNNFHENLRHTNKSNYFPEPQEKNENIFVVKKNFANTPTPMKIKWGFDGQQQNKLSAANEHQITNGRQLFVRRQHSHTQHTNGVKEPIINRILTRPTGTPETPKINNNFFSSRSAEFLSPRTKGDGSYQIPKTVQTHQNTVGSIPKRADTIHDAPCFGKLNLSPQKRFQLSQSVLSSQNTFQGIGQEIQTENDEDFDDSACFDMSEISPQKKIPKHISVSFENHDDSACFVQPETSALKKSPRKRVYSTTTTTMAMEEEFKEIDLRLKILAKKSKLGSDQTQKTGNKIKTSYSNYREKDKDVSPKKRVTFNLGIEDHNTTTVLGDDGQDMMTPNNAEELSTNTLRSLAKPESKTDHWYIVVHTDVLIEDFQFIEKFVLSDEKCILLVPVGVRAEMDSLCVGDCRGRQRVLAARQLVRRLASPPTHIAVQLCEEDIDKEMSVNDSILNCCLQAMEENYHVVLITNDTEMCKKAKSMDLHCFTLQEIKEHAAVEKPKLTFEIRKTTTDNQNNENSRSLVQVIENQLPKLSLEYKKNNVAINNQEKFMIQVSNDCDSSAANTQIPVNVFRKRMFSDENKYNPSLFFRNTFRNITNKQSLSQKSVSNAKISTNRKETQGVPIFAPRNITHNNGNDSLEYEKESSATTSGINFCIEMLNLNENSNTGYTWLKKNQKDESRPQAMGENTQKNSNTIDNKTNCVQMLSTINRYTIDEHLKRFMIEDSVAAERIKTRMDEWVCSFTQILEETLSDVIQNHSPAPNNEPPPWMLPEALECIRDVYGEDAAVRVTVERLAKLLFDNSCKKGYLKLGMSSNDFMKMIGCGTLLIQCLKNILPDAASLSDAEESLGKLFQTISKPSCDPELPQWVHAPVLAYCELSDPMEGERKNFVKKPSEIIEYLVKHFPACQAYNDNEFQETEVVQTFGRNLNLLKLNNSKRFKLKRSVAGKEEKNQNDSVVESVNQTGLEETQETVETFIIKSPELCDYVEENPISEKETGAKLLRKLSLKNSDTLKFKEIDVKRREENDKELTTMIDQMIAGNLTFPTSAVNNVKENNVSNKQASKDGLVVVQTGDTHNFKKHFQQKPKDDIEKFDSVKDNDERNAEMKVIRKINVLDAFKIKKRNEKNNENIVAVDHSVLHNENDNDFISQKTVIIHNNDRECNNDAINNGASQNDPNSEANDANNEESVQNNEEHVENNDDDMNDMMEGDDRSNVSGVVTESQQAISVVKTSLTEFSQAFKIIYRFLKYGINDLRKGVGGNKMKDYNEKASKAHTHMTVIIDMLKSIILRESGSGTTLMELIKTDSNVPNDKRLTRYRQVVIKCLEQATMLESALRVFVGATDKLEGTCSAPSSADIQYYNIFE